MGKGAKIQNIYPLTPMQQGMLFHSLYQKESKAYFQQLSFSLEGELDVSLLERAVNQVIQKYDVFRTVFLYEKLEEPRQVVLEERKLRVYFEDITEKNQQKQKEFLETWKEKDREKGFQLSKDLLMRISVFQTKDKEYQVVWSHHHMILDGWCVGMVMKDVISCYKAFKAGKKPVKEAVYPYASYVNWLGKQNLELARQYWKMYLEGYESEADFPRITKEVINDYEKKELLIILEKDRTEQLNHLCRNYNVTLNHVFQAVWTVLLERCCNLEDVLFGSVVSGRNVPVKGIEKMVGLFINTVPVRIRAEGNLSFCRLLEKMRENQERSSQYEYISLAQIQGQSEIKQNLIRTLYIFENYPARGNMQDGMQGQIRDVESFEQTDYDFNLIVIPGETIQVKLKYNALVYEEKTVKTVEQCLLEILQAVCKNPQVSLKDIKMLPDEEYQRLVYEQNHTYKDYPSDKGIAELFEKQAERTPDQMAVVYKEEGVSYGELKKKTDQVALLLREYGVRKGTVVALQVGRSLEMITAIISVLKAGGAYLPIDPDYPIERVNYMLRDSQAKILITDDKWITKEEKKEFLFEGIVLNIKEKIPTQKEAVESLNYGKPEDLAYIIYTSGTSGKPKGVMIENRNVVNLSFNFYDKVYKRYKKMVRTALLSPYVFDASVKQIFPALLTGQTLVIVPEEERMNGEKLAAYYRKHKIEISDGTPAHLSILQDALSRNQGAFPVKQFLIGGEALSVGLVQNFFQTDSENALRITNVYGPTECCDVAAMFDVDREMAGKMDKIPIGRNLYNVEVYILDRYQNPMPEGFAGEIYIAGAGIGRGYLNQRELTKEHFVKHPFREGEQMYRTGDLGRWLPNGIIEYLGRVDHQVKIRGFRIEPEEIQREMLELEGVDTAAVLCGENEKKSKYIAAFYVTGSDIKADEVRRHLAKNLPYYMIPTYILRVDFIPVTRNGKVDEKNLIGQIVFKQKEYKAPRNTMEEEAAKVWGEVLGVKSVGIQDDFFDLGGDSLKAVKILTRTNLLNIPMSVKDILTYRTIEAIMDQSRLEDSKQETQIYDLKKDRKYNQSFHKTTDYPYYYGCRAGVLQEKLKYEKHLELEKSFLSACGGKCYLTFGYVNGMGIREQLRYLALPTEMNPDAQHLLKSLGMKEKILSFPDFETGYSYLKEQLSKDRLVMVSGTTYYLNYTKDYRMGEKKWRDRLAGRQENVITVSNKSSGRGHTFLLVDMTKENCLIYDTTFSYFGVISMDDFKECFGGLPKMKCLDGTAAQKSNLPYVVTEVDYKEMQEMDNRKLAFKILKSCVDRNLSNQRMDFYSNGNEFTFYTGVRIYKEAAVMIRQYVKEIEYQDDLLKFIQSSFGTWKYTFYFLRDFLQDVSKYAKLPEKYLSYCNEFDAECDEILNQVQKTENPQSFLESVCERLETMYEKQQELFQELNVFYELNQKGV